MKTDNHSAWFSYLRNIPHVSLRRLIDKRSTCTIISLCGTELIRETEFRTRNKITDRMYLITDQGKKELEKAGIV